MGAIRPTLRVLREDLKVEISRLTVPLDEIDHPLLAKAAEQFADLNTPHERIRAVDDELLRGSLRDGHEHAAGFPAFRLGVQVRADEGHETYVAISVTGTPPVGSFVYAVLHMVPGCEPEEWDPCTTRCSRCGTRVGSSVLGRLREAVECGVYLLVHGVAAGVA